MLKLKYRHNNINPAKKPLVQKYDSYLTKLESNDYHTPLLTVSGTPIKVGDLILSVKVCWTYLDKSNILKYRTSSTKISVLFITHVTKDSVVCLNLTDNNNKVFTSTFESWKFRDCPIEILSPKEKLNHNIINKKNLWQYKK